jgi:transposase
VPTGKKPGGQPGHERRLREPVPPEQVDETLELVPEKCRCCGEALSGRDAEPLRHQVTEIPRIQPKVSEYRLHKLACSHCGAETRAELPIGVPRGQFGPVLMATMALLTVRFRQSKRLAQELISTLLNVEVSTGAICKNEQRTSAALAETVERAREHVRAQPVVNGDETGWYEGKSDGRKQRAWLWVATTTAVTVFLIARSRGAAVARTLLGDDFQGIFGSDRWSAYNHLDPLLRQLCWSHLIRDFQWWVDRGGRGGALGQDLLDHAGQMFQWWHRVRDGTMSREDFQDQMDPVSEAMVALLREAAVCPDAKVCGMATEMLKLKDALFTFVNVEGVEPTNNVSERQIRPGVLLRKLSFGTESEAGSRFVERVLTAVASLRQQRRDVLGFFVAAHHAALFNRNGPSLLPA